MGYVKGRASQSAKAAMDASEDLVIDIFAVGVDPFRMIDERLEGEIIINIRFSLFQPHFPRI
jgi:hypothetical protein